MPNRILFFLMFWRLKKCISATTTKWREYYRQNENAYWKGVLATAKAESKAEGRAEGKAEGIAEGEARGEARGIAKERKNLLEAARTMLSEGMDRLKVQHFTKLTDEESLCCKGEAHRDLMLHWALLFSRALCVLAECTAPRLMPMLSKD